MTTQERGLGSTASIGAFRIVLENHLEPGGPPLPVSMGFA